MVPVITPVVLSVTGILKSVAVAVWAQRFLGQEVLELVEGRSVSWCAAAPVSRPRVPGFPKRKYLRISCAKVQQSPYMTQGDERMTKDHAAKGLRVFAAAAALAVASALGTNAAVADETTSTQTAAAGSDVSTAQANATADQVSDAVAAVGAASAASNDAVSVEDNGTAVLDDGSDVVTVDVPADGTGKVAPDGLTTVLDGASDDSTVAVQPTAQGLRAAITIDSPSAPQAYDFPIAGDVTSLRLNDDGSVSLLTTDATSAPSDSEIADILDNAGIDGNVNDIQQTLASLPATSDVEIGRVAPAWAVDAAGNAVPSHYEIDGTTITQVVDFDAGTVFPVVADPSVQNGATYVTIPSNYVYDTNAKQKTLHDYCSYSPDSWGGANFRGPCARHDMCIESGGKSGKSVGSYRPTCDNNLWDNLNSNCKYEYGKWDPRRYACEDTAEVYWATVSAKTVYLRLT